MFINKSRNKSCTTSVRVLEKRGRNNVLVKSMGSSRDEKEIERMVEQAKAFIKRRTGLDEIEVNRTRQHPVRTAGGSRFIIRE